MKSIVICIGGLLCACAALAQSFQNIEAAEWDATANRWLVGNGGNVLAQDANGEISVFSTGNASLGMETMNGNLYAIAGSNINVMELASGELLTSITISGADFLNGMASDPATNRLWVTDFGTNRIHQIDVSDLENPVVSTLINNTVTTPNGITHDPTNNRLMFVAWGFNAPIKTVDLSDNSVSTITTTNLGNLDGIDIDGNGDFYVSSWSPARITRFSNDFSENEIILSTGLDSPADLSYAPEINFVGVADSGTTELVLIDLNPFSVEEQTAASVAVFPNPSKGDSISFESDLPIQSAELFDQHGTLVKQLSLEELQNKRMEGKELPAGMYILQMKVEGEVISQKIVVGK